MNTRKGPRRPPLKFVEVYEPDPERVAEGLKIFGRMIAQAYARDSKRNGHGDPAGMSPEEESHGGDR